MKIGISTLLCCLSMFFLTPAMAQSSNKGPLEYYITLRHLETEAAELRIHAHAAVKDLVVSVSDCGLGMVQETFPSMAAGETKSVSWPQLEGTYQCQISMVATVENGRTWYVDSKHEMLSWSNLELYFDLHELQPQTNAIQFKANRPLTRIQLGVTSVEGEAIAKVDKNIAKPTKEMTVSWEASDKVPALIEVHAEDQHTAWAKYMLFYYQVPHTDIVFDTAESVIRDDQVEHLQESLDKILEIQQLHGQKVAMDLYITGYTDTVGSHESNDKLSRERAKAIATWFRNNGANLTSYYRGLGERSLYKMTPDDTPCEENRRATYILSNRAVPDVLGLEQAAWQKL